VRGGDTVVGTTVHVLEWLLRSVPITRPTIGKPLISILVQWSMSLHSKAERLIDSLSTLTFGRSLGGLSVKTRNEKASISADPTLMRDTGSRS